MANLDSFVQRLSNRQSTEKSTHKGVSGTIRIDDLVLDSVDSICLDFIETVGADNNGWLSTTGKHDDTIPDGVGFWLFGKSLGDGGEILGIGETLCARPSLGLGLVTNNIINIGKDLLKLGTKKLRNEGSREVEDENLGK